MDTVIGQLVVRVIVVVQEVCEVDQALFHLEPDLNLTCLGENDPALVAEGSQVFANSIHTWEKQGVISMKTQRICLKTICNLLEKKKTFEENNES